MSREVKYTKEIIRQIVKEEIDKRLYKKDFDEFIKRPRNHNFEEYAREKKFHPDDMKKLSEKKERITQ